MKSPFEDVFSVVHTGGSVFLRHGGDYIARVHQCGHGVEEQDEWAEFIAHALNKHDALVEACRLMVDTAAPRMIVNMVPQLGDPVFEGLAMVLDSLLDKIKAALKDEGP